MSNLLSRETSPYLLQHAENPVNWYPWGPEALEMARETRRPILLSIGYSACHWCHVMAHESFEDPETAAVMNEYFINIKVDREERPDLDHIYQMAHTVITRRNGGWPLTMFLTPEQVPFAGGTYFPKSSRFGLPAFVSVLHQIRQFYEENRESLSGTKHPVTELLAKSDGLGEGADPDPATLTIEPRSRLRDSLRARFDSDDGGFTPAPKFPHPMDIAACLREYETGGEAFDLWMARHTLERMASGGIYDQIGGGFSRYSVDGTWTIPHFEKMLYDNALLLCVYAEGALLCGDASLVSVCEGIVTWLFREMRDSSGAFHAALDADSEGEEGKYYVWTREEVAGILTPEEYQVVSLYYGLLGTPNFEHEFWHFRVELPVAEAASRLSLKTESFEGLLASAKEKLLEVRKTRVPPGKDDKVLTGWNGLLARGLIRSGRVLDRKEWILEGQRILDILRETLWTGDHLLAVRTRGESRLNAYLDDYAYVLDALVESLAAVYRPSDLEWALLLGDALVSKFWDDAAGGFHFTSHDHEQLIHRPKSGHDAAIPSGSAVACRALNRLAHLCGRMDWADKVGRTLALYFKPMLEQPMGYASMIMSLGEYLSPPVIVLVRGKNSLEWSDTARAKAPLDALIIDLGERDSLSLPDFFQKPLVAAGTQADVCGGGLCLPPATDMKTLVSQIATLSVQHKKEDR
ncbi:MAG: thioredoxin domain-containing protein [Leptospirillum sp.]